MGWTIKEYYVPIIIVAPYSMLKVLLKHNKLYTWYIPSFMQYVDIYLENMEENIPKWESEKFCLEDGFLSLYTFYISLNFDSEHILPLLLETTK